MSHTEELASFRSAFPARPPDRNRISHEDQLVRLGVEDGVRFLIEAPIEGVAPGDPPEDTRRGTGCHLWVIDERGVPFILEQAPAAARLHDRVAKHSNLTGGEPAHCGGEVWFEEASTAKLWVSGGSGRYGPRSPEEMESAVAVFMAFGYATISLGWDEQTNRALRVLP